MLGQAGNRQRARHGAERQHELAPPDRLRPVVGHHGGGLRLEVEGRHAAEDQVGVRAHLAQRHDAVPRLERPRRCFGQERGVEHEVLLAHDRRPAVAELLGDIGAGKAPADDEHPAARFSGSAHLS